MTARTDILARVRNAIGDNSASLKSEYVALPQDYRQAGQLTREEVLTLFSCRLRDYETGVYRCSGHEIPDTVAGVMLARGKGSLLRPQSLPQQWLPGGYEFLPSDHLSYCEIDRAEGVITACVAAIALTGTIIVAHAPGDGGRALTLIPDYHLCVVFADQIVETVPEGFARLRGLERLPITTISGPSATADIEMTRVKGVHGPRFLDVIVVV